MALATTTLAIDACILVSAYMGIAGVYREPKMLSLSIGRPDFAIAADRQSMVISVSRQSFTIVVHQLLE